jgi:hypothetical protein
MDYAFAPSEDFYHRASRQLMANRPNTQVIQQRGLNTVVDFLAFLDTGRATPAIQHPAGYVSLGRTIGSQNTLGLKIEFRHDRPSFTYTITGLPGQPTGKTNKFDALRQALNDDAATAGPTRPTSQPAS